MAAKITGLDVTVPKAQNKKKCGNDNNENKLARKRIGHCRRPVNGRCVPLIVHLRNFSRKRES